jgi:hypothetical protein
MKIELNQKDYSPKEWSQIMSLVGLNYKLSLSGKERSEITESRLRSVINEKKPNTTEHDFKIGPLAFFSNERVELKQFTVSGKSPKLQQVKPHLYEKILVAAEFNTKTEWYVLNTSQISKKSGRENKENNKLTLTRQHKGNEREGQISFNSTFKKFATLITTTKPINYTQEDLGLDNEILFQILNQVKNH